MAATDHSLASLKFILGNRAQLKPRRHSEHLNFCFFCTAIHSLCFSNGCCCCQALCWHARSRAGQPAPSVVFFRFSMPTVPWLKCIERWLGINNLWLCHYYPWMIEINIWVFTQIQTCFTCADCLKSQRKPFSSWWSWCWPALLSYSRLRQNSKYMQEKDAKVLTYCLDAIKRWEALYYVIDFVVMSITRHLSWKYVIQLLKYN